MSRATSRDEVQARLRASRLRSVATVRRAIGVVTGVIRQNRLLARAPGHRSSAERRIREGETELEHLRAEERALEGRIASPTRDRSLDR